MGAAFLAKELEQLAPQGGAPAEGRGVVDELVRVWLSTGEVLRLLIHLEIQQRRRDDFPLRMYRYNYRIEDRHGPNVISVAILADADRSWRPCVYEHELLGTRKRFEFLSAKLIDLDEASLRESDNPFALMVLAHLKTLATRGDPERRLSWKQRLVEELLERSWSAEATGRLFRLIEWLLRLPRAHEARFDRFMEKKREEGKVTFVSMFEREALAKGRAEGEAKGRAEGEAKGRAEGEAEGRATARREDVLRILQARFGQVPAGLAERVRSLDPAAPLEPWIDRAATAASLDEFAGALPPTE